MTDVTDTAASSAPGEEVDNVWVQIDYAILQHFSKHLYSSPNKAVEELVTNGYDALAQQVDVFLPGKWADDCLLVWDDGTSMDERGLKQLWWIAQSPKSDGGPDRVARSEDGTIERRMIGKFGIGKLASYAVGNRLTHLCRRGNRFLLVAVDYKQAPALRGDPPADGGGFNVPVLLLDEATAREFALRRLATRPSDFEELFARDHWTLAIVDDLKPDVSLTPGRLSWVLGNGMPLRPDFEVRVDGKRVKPTLETTALVKWDTSRADVQKSLKSQWEQQAKSEGGVGGTLSFGVDNVAEPEQGGPSRRPPKAWVEVPVLGRVKIVMKLFKTSLKESRAGQHGRSEGFFVYVLNRLLNPDDPKLLLPDPSFGAFNRMQITMWADGLDTELLADRERLQQSEMRKALVAVQHAVYLAGRAYLEAYDARSAADGGPEPQLPSDSRDYFRQPLVAAAQRHRAENEPVIDPSAIRVATEAASSGDALMRIAAEQNQLVLNTAHPLYDAVLQKVGTNKKARREVLRVVELIGVSDILLEGHLLDLGVDEDLVDEVVAWRTSQLSTIAARYTKRPDEVLEELEAASYDTGGRRFEEALASLFRTMGFVAYRDGASGKRDVIVEVPIGRDAFRFIVEAKGKKTGGVGNSDAEISGAASHAAKSDARFALVVAREFSGFSKSTADGPAILGECRTQTPPVAIATVECLRELCSAMLQNHYPLDFIVPALEIVESPEDKLNRVRETLKDPIDDFDVRPLLERVWDLQNGAASGLDAVPVLQLMQHEAWRKIPRTDFEAKILALESLSSGLIKINPSRGEVVMRQSPELVAARIEETLSSRRAAPDA